MSQSQQPQQQQLQDRSSPYATDEDWWYDDLEDDEPTASHDELTGTSRAEYVAHKILKQGATLLDPIALKVDPTDADLHSKGERVAVTEPCEYVPKRNDGDNCYAERDYGAYDKRWRVDKEYGYLVRGPVIDDRPLEEFLEHVELALDAGEYVRETSISDREREAILERAERMKRDGAYDVTAMAEVVRCIDNPGRATDNN